MKRDPLYVAILLVVGVVVGWLLLTPFVPAIARTTMKRFHLSEESFAVWAAQVPIPAMYNFANRYEIRELPEDLFSPIFVADERRFINHFPARVLTFANGRYTLLHPGQDRWVTMESTYRGQTLVTKIHARPRGDGDGFDWVVEPGDDQ